MKFEAEGEWVVSTPILAGTGEDIEAARRCSHPIWKEECREIREGALVILERCTTCRFTTRGRYRPVKEGDFA